MPLASIKHVRPIQWVTLAWGIMLTAELKETFEKLQEYAIVNSCSIYFYCQGKVYSIDDTSIQPLLDLFLGTPAETSTPGSYPGMERDVGCTGY